VLDPLAWFRPLREWVAGQPLGRRLAHASLIMVAFRLLVLVAGLIPLGAPGAGRFEPRLGAMALALAVAGIVSGAAWGAKVGDRSDLVAAGFAGGLAGLFGAAIGFALVRSFESILGSWSSSLPAVLLFWWLLGAGLALLSWIVLPPRESTRKPEPSP
jgi:hypothetical protein